MKNDVILLASGGLDSTTMAFWLKSQGINFVPLFINYGQHCAKTELDTLYEVLPSGFSEKVEIVDVSSIYRNSRSRFIKPANLWEDDISADDLYIPYRNVLLLTIAASFAQTVGISDVYSAFINSNHAKEIDCSNEFFEKMENMLADYGSVRIHMPFRHMSKYQVAKIGIEVGASIGTTFSCQASPYVPCGACPNCVDRLDALRMIANETV